MRLKYLICVNACVIPFGFEFKITLWKGRRDMSYFKSNSIILNDWSRYIDAPPYARLIFFSYYFNNDRCYICSKMLLQSGKQTKFVLVHLFLFKKKFVYMVPVKCVYPQLKCPTCSWYSGYKTLNCVMNSKQTTINPCVFLSSMLVTSTLVQTSSLVVFWVQGIILEDKFCLYCPLDMYWIPGFFRGQFVFAVFAVVIQSAKTTRHKLGQYTSRKRRKNS